MRATCSFEAFPIPQSTDCLTPFSGWIFSDRMSLAKPRGHGYPLELGKLDMDCTFYPIKSASNGNLIGETLQWFLVIRSKKSFEFQLRSSLLRTSFRWINAPRSLDTQFVFLSFVRIMPITSWSFVPGSIPRTDSFFFLLILFPVLCSPCKFPKRID